MSYQQQLPTYPGGAVDPGAAYGRPAPLDGISLASFITSLVGLNIVGIVLGAVGLSRTKNGVRSGRGFAIAGLVIGIVSLVIAIVVVTLVLTGAITYGVAVSGY